MENMEMKVAGVKFNNDAEDGGESRQDILRELRHAGKRIVTLDFIYTQYDGEQAIKVRELSTKKIIGWVPKNMVKAVMEKKIKRTIGIINKYMGTEYVMIRKPEFPTNVEYHRMKAMCAKKGVEMPAYDRQAYKVWEKNVLNAA